MLCSYGKPGSSSAEGENKSQEPTTAKVIVDNGSFSDDLSGICRINRDVTYDVEVKKEDGDGFIIAFRIHLQLYREFLFTKVAITIRSAKYSVFTDYYAS